MLQLWQNNTSRTQEETAISGFVNYIKIFPVCCIYLWPDMSFAGRGR